MFVSSSLLYYALRFVVMFHFQIRQVKFTRTCDSETSNKKIAKREKAVKLQCAASLILHLGAETMFRLSPCGKK